MKKILLCLCLLCGYGVANDENISDSTNRHSLRYNQNSEINKSGWFIGFEFGLSETGVRLVASETSDLLSGDISLSSPLYGFRAGYKHFFIDFVGLAAYLGFRDSYIDFDDNVKALDSTSLHFMPIMINVDILFDFYQIDDFSFGAIVGVGLGLGIAIDSGFIGYGNVAHLGFYSDAKVGMGMNYGANRMGLVAYFPISTLSKNTQGVEYKIKSNYALSLTYDYRF